MVLFQILSEGSSGNHTAEIGILRHAMNIFAFLEWTNDLNADVTRLLISDEEESVLSAGIPSGLRVRSVSSHKRCVLSRPFSL